MIYFICKCLWYHFSCFLPHGVYKPPVQLVLKVIRWYSKESGLW